MVVPACLYTRGVGGALTARDETDVGTEVHSVYCLEARVSHTWAGPFMRPMKAVASDSRLKSEVGIEGIHRSHFSVM